MSNTYVSGAASILRQSGYGRFHRRALRWGRGTAIWWASTGLAWLLAFGTSILGVAQQPTPPTPGPEHEKLKQLVGTWDVSAVSGDNSFRGTMVWKLDMGGLWLAGSFEGEFAGQKFSGRGFDTYDPNKKKYVSVWIDSMSTSPAVFEGNYDPSGKVLTMEGEGPGEDGKPTKFRIVIERKDDNHFVETMHVKSSDGMWQPIFQLGYRRR